MPRCNTTRFARAGRGKANFKSFLAAIALVSALLSATPASGWLLPTPVLVHTHARRSLAVQRPWRTRTSQRTRAISYAMSDSMPYTLDDQQAQANSDLHAKECQRMQEEVMCANIVGKQPNSYNAEDFESLSLSSTLIGEVNNGPFMSNKLIHYTKKPLFSAQECDDIVAEAEEHAKRLGGWSTARHYSHPTTDIRITDLPRAKVWFAENLRTKLFPAIAACFPNLVKEPEALRIFDVFVVKYNAERQSYLKVHRDSSLISVTIALNDKSDFEGGGMFVEPLNQVIELDKGQAVTFASNIRHGGHKVTSGLRYILVGFLVYEGYVEHDRRLLERSQQDAGEYAEGIQSFKKALEIDDRYVEGWTNLAVCEGLSGDDEGAVKSARRAVDMNDGDFVAHFNLACALEKSGDILAAMAEYTLALKINSDDSECYNRRAALHLQLGELKQAISDYRVAVKLQPGNADALNDFGVALYEAEEYQEALDQFAAAVRLDGSHTEAAKNAALLADYLGVDLSKKKKKNKKGGKS